MGNRKLGDRITAKELEVQRLKDELERLRRKAREEHIQRRNRANFHLGEVVAEMVHEPANDPVISAIRKAVTASQLSEEDKAAVLVELRVKQKISGR